MLSDSTSGSWNLARLDIVWSMQNVCKVGIEDVKQRPTTHVPTCVRDNLKFFSDPNQTAHSPIPMSIPTFGVTPPAPGDEKFKMTPEVSFAFPFSWERLFHVLFFTYIFPSLTSGAKEDCWMYERPWIHETVPRIRRRTPVPWNKRCFAIDVVVTSSCDWIRTCLTTHCNL